MEQECLDNCYTHLSQKRLKPTKNCLEEVDSFFSVSIIKMCHKLMYLINYKSQGCITSAYTTLIPIFPQKRIKPTKNCLETVNSFVSVSMTKICHNPMHLTNHKTQRWSMSVQTTFIPIFSQKRLKPTEGFLEAVNSVASVSKVKMCQNSMHITNQKS